MPAAARTLARALGTTRGTFELARDHAFAASRRRCASSVTAGGPKRASQWSPGLVLLCIMARRSIVDARAELDSLLLPLGWGHGRCSGCVGRRT